MNHPYSKKAEQYLQKLCHGISNRRVGGTGNQEATEYFKQITSSFGFKVDSPEFTCIDWHSEGASLSSGKNAFEVFSSPYSVGCQVIAPLQVISSFDELQSADAEGSIVLLRGEIAKEQLMPMNFTFYNPEEHKLIYRLLEEKGPAAIITATAPSPGTAGSIYPLPMFEDGDFDIPSVFMTEEEGLRLAEEAGQTVHLESKSERIPSRGCNAVAYKNPDASKKLVFTAHIDARYSTPGALDNASGITVLLLLAEMLQAYRGNLGIELVALNGEDYYANPGELLYLQQNQNNFPGILLNINIDDIGYLEGGTHYSLYHSPDDLAGVIRKCFSGQSQMAEGEAWYQGDHMIFVQNNVPALALTSQQFMQVLAEITHSERDIPAVVDPSKLGQAAAALFELVEDLNQFIDHAGKQ